MDEKPKSPILRISLLVVLGFIFSGYHLVGGWGLLFAFHGPWSGIGAHADPPGEAIMLLFDLIFFAYALGGMNLFTRRTPYLQPTFRLIQKNVAPILMTLELIFWGIFLGLFLTGNHRMIVDLLNHDGGTLGSSSLKASYWSQLSKINMGNWTINPTLFRYKVSHRNHSRQ